MLKQKSIIGSSLIILLVVALLAGCGSKPAAEQPKAAAGNDFKGKQLVMATNATFPPFESVVLDNGAKQYEGLDIDIATAIAKKIGFTYTVTDMAFSGIIGSLKDGRADFAVSGMSPTPERLKNVDFSEPYFFPRNAIVAAKGSNYTTTDSLIGKKISVPFGTTYEKDAQKIKEAQVIPLDGSPAVIQELNNKRVDAAILDGAEAEEFIKKNPGLEMNLLPPTDESFAMVFPKGSKLVEPFNQELKKMKANGELNELIKKWLGEKFQQ